MDAGITRCSGSAEGSARAGLDVSRRDVTGVAGVTAVGGAGSNAAAGAAIGSGVATGVACAVTGTEALSDDVTTSTGVA